MKNIIRIVGIIISVVLIVSCFLSGFSANISAENVNIWDGTTASAYAGGDGSAANPYQIANGAQLVKMAKSTEASKYYLITNDIYLNDVTKTNWETNSPNSWYVRPDSDTTNYFSGTIDGGDHTIYGLYYNGSNSKCGLITQIKGTVTFKNLIISDAYFETTSVNPGGKSDTNIGTSAFVGFCSSSPSLILERCYVSDSVDIKAKKGAGSFGGYGSLATLELTNCATFANIAITDSSYSKYHGALGYFWNYSKTDNLDNCILGANLTANSKLGGAASNSYTNYTGSDSYSFSGLTKINDSQMKGTAAATNMPALDWTNVWQTTDGYPVLIKKAPEIIEPQIEGLGESWEDFAADSYAGGSGTQSNPYEIETAAQLAKLVKDSATNGKYYVITKDIQLNKTSKDGFGSKRNWLDSNQNSYYFQGNLDGRNHVISGLYYYNGNVTTNTYSALIPRTKDNAVISNIILKNSSLTMISYLSGSDPFSSVAGIVAHANGNTRINNCYVEKTVTLKNIMAPGSTKKTRAGGIVGAGSKSIYVNSCAFFGDITLSDISSSARYGAILGDLWGNSTYKKEVNKCISDNITPANYVEFSGSKNIFAVKPGNSNTQKKKDCYVLSAVECDEINPDAIRAINDSFYLTEYGYPKPCGLGNRFCDVNGDLKTTADDLTAMVNLILEKDTIGCLNINGDGYADILDLVYLKKTLATKVTIQDTYNNVPEDMELSEETSVSVELKSVTITMYDVQNNTYGVTWNSSEIPLEPVIQVCEGPLFDASNATEYSASFNKYSSYSDASTTFDYYVSKGIITLAPDRTYTYRAYDKQKKIASKIGTITTNNHNPDSFTFMHFSDSQVNGSNEKPGGAGSHFQKALAAAVKDTANMAFALHTGDIVEWSKYEAYWENMLDKYNSDYFMSIPFMPISGNHETTYRNGSNETFKHFNLNLPSQDTTKGVYYSYDYGNTRFIMINTNRVNSDKTLTSDQYDWLVSVLKNRPSNIKWTIVSMHCPMYSVGKYGSNSSNNAASVALKNQLSKLFADNDVDLVLQGHDHEYSKTKPIISPDTVDTSYTTQTINGVKYDVNPKGTVYAMHGPAGSQTRAPESTVNAGLYDYYNTENTNPHSFAKISVDGDKITVNIMYESGGNAVTVYSYGIIKN